MPVPIVDCHSHVFNAEDLPIDGFIKRTLYQVPPLLMGILSVPLDRLTQWVATSPKTEAAYLASLLQPPSGLETIEVAPPPVGGSELVTDFELDELFVAEWQRRGLLPPDLDTGLEGTVDIDVLLADSLAGPGADETRTEVLAWLTESSDPELEADDLESFGDWLPAVQSLKRSAGRYLDALRLITRDRHLVASEVAKTYSRVALFVPALVDFEYTARDAPSASVTKQVHVHSLLSRVSMAGRIPGAPPVRVHPIVGFCPRREVETSELHAWMPGEANPYVPYADPATAGAEDRYHDGITFDLDRAHPLASPSDPPRGDDPWLDGVTRSLDVVRHAVERGGFVGVKLYPPAGYLPVGNAADGGADGARLDAALRSLYTYCQTMDVPILAHANHSNGFADTYAELAGPRGWKAVLHEFPRLRICFGHFGHLWQVGPTPANPDRTAWVMGFVELVDAFPHVYGDVGNSRFPIDDEYRSNYLELLGFLMGGTAPSTVQTKRRARLMFGTDFWMNTLSPGHRDYLSVFETHYRATFDDDTAGEFFGGNALRWLGLVDDNGEPDPRNANRARLLAFYGDRPRPGWLR